MASELYPKRVALLKQALPKVTQVALLMNPGNPYAAEAERLARTAGRSLGVELEVFNVRYAEDFEKAFDKMSSARVQAVLVGSEFLFQASVTQLGELALKYHLPLMAAYYASGVLIAYNVDNEESYRRAAGYVDKILKGAKAGDLPIEQPTNIKLFVDLRTAKALGVTTPQSVVLRADEVIQ
jgi:putative ABC transport system substrate-binding protein